MTSRVLDDFTVEKYMEMRNRLRYDHRIANELFISGATLCLWKRKNGVKTERANMPKNQRVEIIKKMLKEGAKPAQIAKAVNFKSDRSVYEFINSVKKEGYEI